MCARELRRTRNWRKNIYIAPARFHLLSEKSGISCDCLRRKRFCGTDAVKVRASGDSFRRGGIHVAYLGSGGSDATLAKEQTARSRSINKVRDVRICVVRLCRIVCLGKEEKFHLGFWGIV